MYVRELVAALAAARPEDRLELFAHRLRRPGGSADRAPLPANARLHRSRLPAPAVALAARAGWGADRLLGSVDVVHWTDYVALVSTRAPVVATIHDVCFVDHPVCYTRAQRERLHAVTGHAVATAARLIVPSARVRADLVRHFGTAADRVHVIPHGCRPLPDVAPAADLGRYLLFVGTLQPRKNVARLVEAFDAVHAAHPDLRLVVAGGRGWLDDDILQGIERRAHVVHIDRFDAARLAALYRGALAVALPSLGEGFGLPVLEALHCGRAVLVGADTACSDFGGDAVLPVDSGDVGAIADGLLRLTEDDTLRARLEGQAQACAAPYTWERTARATRDVYVQAVGS